MPSFQVLVLGFLFVSFHPSSLRSHSCSTSACLPLSPSACPLPIRFLSPASLPVLITQPSASSFLPSGRSPHSWLFVQAPVPYVPFALPLHPRLVSRPLPFVRIRSTSGYSARCFFLSALPASASQWLPRCAPPLSLPGFPRSLQPDLSCFPSRFPYSALLFVSFRPTLLRSRSRSTGDPLLNLFSGAGA